MRQERAEIHLSAIARRRALIATLRQEVASHQRRLARIVVLAYNEAAEELDEGDAMEAGDVIFRDEPCLDSPIQHCVLGRNTMSLPARRLVAAQRRGTHQKVVYDTSMRSDACLFCGHLVDPDRDDPV